MDGSARKLQTFQRSFKTLNEYREQNILCDATLKVEWKTFHIHKSFIASHSKYFEKLFTTAMLESRQEVIEIGEISIATFESVLNHMYGIDISIDFENLLSIMLAADRFCVDTLLEICQDFLIENWKDMEAKEVVSLADHFKLKQIKHQTDIALRYFQGSLAHLNEYQMKLDESFIVLAVKDQPLLHPTLALRALGKWVEYDTSRVVYLTYLLEFYPLEQIPVQAVKNFIEDVCLCNRADFPSLEVELNEVLNRKCALNYNCAHLQILDIQNTDPTSPSSLASCMSASDLYRFEAGSCNWVFDRKLGPLLQIIPFEEGFCILTPCRIYIHKSGGEVSIKQRVFYDHRNSFYCTRKDKIVWLYSQEDTTHVREGLLTKDSLELTNTLVVIPRVHKPGAFVDNRLLYVVGGEHTRKVTEESEKIECQACYSYNFDTKKLEQLSYLCMPISRPVLCKYNNFLIIISPSPTISGNLLLHYLHLPTCQINFCKSEILYFSPNKIVNGWTDVELLCAEVPGFQNELTLVFSVKNNKNKPAEILIATSTIKEDEGERDTKVKKLFFGPVNAKRFLATHDHHVKSYAFFKTGK